MSTKSGIRGIKTEKDKISKINIVSPKIDKKASNSSKKMHS